MKQKDEFVYLMEKGNKASKSSDKTLPLKWVCLDKVIVKKVISKDQKVQKITRNAVVESDKMKEKEDNVRIEELPMAVERVPNVLGQVDAYGVINLNDLDTTSLKSLVMVLSLLLRSPIFYFLDDKDRQLLHAIREDGETL